MKRLTVLLALLVVFIILAGCATGSRQVSQRAIDGIIVGGLTGAAIGGATGDDRAAAIGAGIGAAGGAIVGAFVGIKEEGTIRQEPTPLPWIEGKRVLVQSGRGGYWQDGIKAIIEDELRGRGAIIVTSINRYYYNREENIGADYIAEYDTDRRGNDGVIVIRVISRADNIVKAMGAGRYYRYDYNNEYLVFANAAKAAVTSLH